MERMARTLTIQHRESTVTNSPYAYKDILDKETVRADNLLIPFHAIDNVIVEIISEEYYKPTYPCKKTCDDMGNPIIIGKMTDITVETGEEFDPTEGITAYDENGKVLDISVEVED